MTNQTAANRYAKALFDVALNEADPQAVEADLAAKGIAMLDSPITGGVQRAWAGDITVVTSGPQAVFDQGQPDHRLCVLVSQPGTARQRLSGGQDR